VVEKQMFTLLNNENIVLRPEGTIICVACLAKQNAFRNDSQQKLFYCEPMFRHEKSQLGRYREFQQFGIESFNLDSDIQEYEIITICWRIFIALGLSNRVVLHINNLGQLQERDTYVSHLVRYLQQCNLTQQQELTLNTNPLRLLDSNDIGLQDQLAQAPSIHTFVNNDKFDLLVKRLATLNIPLKIDYRLVRGLDYYTGTVFEWKTRDENLLGRQNTLCAGGRFDQLLEYFTGQSMTAFGCAFGIDRILLLNQQKHNIARYDMYIFCLEKDYLIKAFDLREKFLYLYQSISIYLNYQLRSEKNNLDSYAAKTSKVVIKVSEEVEVMLPQHFVVEKSMKSLLLLCDILFK
jgi:histidyl-tRNA synthetase